MANPSQGGDAKLEVSPQRDSSAASLSSDFHGWKPDSDGRSPLNIRARAAISAAISSLALVAYAAPAQANLLSVLPGSCGTQQESQIFGPWGDDNNYFLLTGGSFEGTQSWARLGGATEVAGNESYYVHGSVDSTSLSLPAGSSATSPAVCTSIYDPTLRLFVRNTGSSTSRLKVEALYPGPLGAIRTATIGHLSGTSSSPPSRINTSWFQAKMGLASGARRFIHGSVVLTSHS